MLVHPIKSEESEKARSNFGIRDSSTTLGSHDTTLEFCEPSLAPCHQGRPFFHEVEQSVLVEWQSCLESVCGRAKGEERRKMSGIHLLDNLNRVPIVQWRASRTGQKGLS